MNKLTLLIVSLNLLFFGMACAETWPPREKTTLTIRVVDDDGRPVEDANVRVATFFSQGGEERSLNFRTKSDHRGFAHFEERLTPHIHIHVTKQNHYETRKDIYALFHRYGHITTEDEPIELALREIRNPIPMVGVIFRKALKEESGRIGFDLKVGDWVAPHGLGNEVDFFAQITRDIESRERYHSVLTITFPNEYDGIFSVTDDFSDSRFKTPRTAPMEGYVNAFDSVKSRDGLERSWDPNAPPEYFVLRTRTQTDDTGNLISANYTVTVEGPEIVGPIAEHAGLFLHYWFNPNPNDRNLEFDPSQNLAED